MSKTKAVGKLFEGWQKTMIRFCLQGMMGHLYADAEEQQRLRTLFAGSNIGNMNFF